jgi:hypothetical protein
LQCGGGGRDKSLVNPDGGCDSYGLGDGDPVGDPDNILLDMLCLMLVLVLAVGLGSGGRGQERGESERGRLHGELTTWYLAKNGREVEVGGNVQCS